MTKSLLVYIADNSGSMWNIQNDMNGCIERLLKDSEIDPETRVTFVHFSNSFDYREVLSNARYGSIDVNKVKIKADGSTALLDAIGKTLTSVAAFIDNASDAERPDNVLVTIITDGEENSSIEYSKSLVFDMINNLKEAHGWKFNFVGANQDSIKEAQAIGIDPSYSVDYVTNSSGISTMTSYLVNNARSMTSSGTIPEVSEEVRTDLAEAGSNNTI